MGSSPDWLDRYQNGHRAQVWQELRQLGAAVHEPKWAAEAQLVCDAMARRARRNVERIVERLTDDGYVFHTNDDERTPVTPHVPPSPNAEAHVRWLEERFGVVPMTLSSWVRIVGDVWLVGTHPKWESSASADPLVVEAEGSRHGTEDFREYVEGDLEGWREYRDEDPGSAGLFVLPLAPDKFHKENVSGGEPYGIAVPDGCADGLFSWETTMPFVSYLNWVFGEGGFPLATGDPAQWEVRHRLVQGILPL